MEDDTPETPTVVAVSCGSSHSVALLSCDIVVSWGRGEDGQLGHGDADERLVPTAVYTLLNGQWHTICCGAEYTVAVSRARNQVYSWGWGDFGRLGHGHSNDVFIPVPIQFFSGKVVTKIACGDTHTLAITDTGDLHSFGRNQNGQLGLGHTNDVLEPRLVEALQAYGWGWGRYGNLGDGECQDRWTPVKVLGLTGVNVSQVCCGWRHSAAVSEDGRIFTFGWSKYGQLGHGDNNDRLIATEVELLKGRTIALVAGGWRHTLAADSQGTLYAWGWNKFGQLGVGDTNDRNAPAVVHALSEKKIAQLACGWRHTMCVTGEGEVYTWGRGVNGQLGLGDLQDRSSPVLLHALCKGHLNVDAITATATSTASSSGYIKAADRYAVVPDSHPMGLDQEPAQTAHGAYKRPRSGSDVVDEARPVVDDMTVPSF